MADVQVQTMADALDALKELDEVRSEEEHRGFNLPPEHR